MRSHENWEYLIRSIVDRFIYNSENRRNGWNKRLLYELATSKLIIRMPFVFLAYNNILLQAFVSLLWLYLP